MKNFLIGASLFVAGSGIISAQSNYIAPKPNHLMFQVDKLPMDKGTRVWLSKQLTTLAKRENNESAKEQKLTAYLLMLAMRVHSGNTEAVDTNQTLAIGGHIELVSTDESNKAASNIEVVVKNLSATETGSEAHLLADYLKDVLHTFNPEGNVVIGHTPKLSRWEGILPKPAPIPKRPEPTDVAFDKVPKNETTLQANIPDPVKTPEKPVILTKWNQGKSSITTPLLIEFLAGEGVTISTSNRTELVTLNTTITPQNGSNSNLTLKISPSQRDLGAFQNQLLTVMKSRFGKFQSVNIDLKTEQKLSAHTRGDITLPICLQLLASEKNVNIKKGTKVLGSLAGNKIKRNWNSWEKLKYLLPKDTISGPLIVPSDSEPDFVQLIALKQESFFIRHEVLTASTLEQAVGFLNESENTDIYKASEEFANIQRLIGTKSVGPYSVDKLIRQRLEKILSKNPNHLSAKMILLRGNSERNKRLERYYIAKEASSILNRYNWLVGVNNVQVYSNDYFENSIKEIEAFKKQYADLTDTEDRDLVQYLINIADTFEIIIRSKKKRESKSNTKTIQEALSQFSKQFKDARKGIADATKTLPAIIN